MRSSTSVWINRSLRIQLEMDRHMVRLAFGGYRYNAEPNRNRVLYLIRTFHFVYIVERLFISLSTTI